MLIEAKHLGRGLTELNHAAQRTVEVSYCLCADSAADPPSVNQAVLPVLCNQQGPQEVAITFSLGISDDMTNGRFLRFHLEP